MGEQVAPSPHIPSASSFTLTPSTVSWQSAFWTLIPIATNLITQPSGRVLSLHIRHRTYLRSSPIICALDATSFLLRIICLPLLLRVPFHKAFNIVVSERFKGSGGDHDGTAEAENGEGEEGIQSLEAQTWLRWVFFLVGTLGPAIKLTAMEGVPWTKSWGMMFLCSWVVFETMIFNSRKDYTSLPQSQDATSESRALRVFRKIDQNAFFLGASLHVILLLWAIVSCWTLRGDHYHDVWAEPKGPLDHQELIWPASLMPPIAALGAVIFLANGALTLPMFFFLGKGIWENRWQLLSICKKNFIPCCIWVSLPSGLLFGAIVGGMQLPLSTYVVDVPILLGVVGGVPLLMLGTSWLCSKFPSLGKKLLLRQSEFTTMWAVFGVVLSDLANLAFFLANLALCLAWYSLKYDAQYTVNPEWTGIFG